MKIAKALFSVGRSSFVHQDREAIRRGAKPNGYLFDGEPVLPGFDAITQAAEIVSVMLVLDDGLIAHGDCADVILAGYAGRDRPFKSVEHMETLKKHIAPLLVGRELSSFRPLAEEFDRLTVDGKPLHMAVRYGITQALLHAVALARREQMAEVVAREYGQRIVNSRIPILSSCMRDNYNLHDRMILKRADILPHSSFGDIDLHIGRDGRLFLDYVTKFRRRVQEIGAPDYKPQLHFDVYGSIGQLFEEDVERTADYLGRVADAVAPFDLMIESPFVLDSLSAQIEIFGRLRSVLGRKGINCTIIADEWCNTLEDIRAWGEAKATDMVQIKTPDLGGINNTIEAAIYCNSIGMAAYLGGTANETDQSSRITTHIGLATRPTFLLSKPGMGGDESFALQINEMSRTLTILGAAGCPLLDAAA
ncbi:methylaspartate ammonia-lyase [Aquamicrobium sp. LC103]|uniref:methylaspartate ammonia-lyase n=1 Tax=Aquamicrobium sp. LC103 TaxID=1120658 RepID=UPI00063E9824|nr:methylaspartate ammonia-lyase [Aquamicrobium sp. LC103]TKT74587.1 methylaspartate ammonia-lyase [Aquamicrobium sp. LC103]